MEAIIRDATPNDMAAILGLIKELAEFEKAPDVVEVTERDLFNDGFKANPDFKSIVAEIDGQIVGMALFYIGYSSWKGKMVFLDDLIVQENWRNNGIGARLLHSVIEFADRVHAKIIKWQVLNWNKPAIDFYKSYGVVFDDEWIDCKMYKIQLTEHLEKKTVL